MVIYENFNNHSSDEYTKLSQLVSTMTSSRKNKKTSKKQEKNDDNTKKGPKRNRHPSGDVCLDIIFMKEIDGYKNKLSGYAELYQNLIEYSLSKDYSWSQYEPAGKQGFKTNEIGHWILKHNQDYINHYKGMDSHIKDSIKLDGVLKRIKRYLLNLEQWGLIEKLGEVDPDTNNRLKTPLYHFTYVGYLIAWVLEYDYKPGKRKIARRAIFDLIQLILLKNFYSYMTDFLARVYAKCMEKDLEVSPFIPENARRILDRIIIALIRLLSSGKFQFPKAIEYLSMAQLSVMTNEESREIFLGRYFEALQELSEDTRKKIIAHEKAEIESRIVVSQPSKDWEEIWLNNTNNHDGLVLYAVCQNKECPRRHYPAIVNYYYYRKNLMSSMDYNYLIEDCRYCNTKSSLYVFDSYEAARLNMNNG
jgi:hypothetical protein